MDRAISIGKCILIVQHIPVDAPVSRNRTIYLSNSMVGHTKFSAAEKARGRVKESLFFIASWIFSHVAPTPNIIVS